MSSIEEGAAALVNCCELCGASENLSRCARCRVAFYCCKDHQKEDWKRHKVTCKKLECNESVEKKYGHILSYPTSTSIPNEGSSESEVLSSLGERLGSPNNNYQALQLEALEVLPDSTSTMPVSGVRQGQKTFKNYPEINLSPMLSLNQDEYLEEMCRNVIQDLTDYGLCVVDNFLGAEKGKRVLSEVMRIQHMGLLRDGQLVDTRGKNEEELKRIRSDKIYWAQGSEPNCPYICYLVNQVDSVIMRANRMPNNGKLGQYTINGRTKVSYIWPYIDNYIFTHCRRLLTLFVPPNNKLLYLQFIVYFKITKC